MEGLETKEISMEDAVRHINVIRTQLNQMGNNDSEFDQLNGIEEALRGGDLSPAEAMTQATAIQTNKIER